MPPAPNDEPSIDATRLLDGLLAIVGGAWVASSQFERLARELKLEEGAPMIQFLTGIRGLLSELPVKMFQSDDSRRAVINAAQDALDAAIDREEEMLEAQDGTPPGRESP